MQTSASSKPAPFALDRSRIETLDRPTFVPSVRSQPTTPGARQSSKRSRRGNYGLYKFGGSVNTFYQLYNVTRIRTEEKRINISILTESSFVVL